MTSAVLAVFALAACSYGAPRDNSGFEAAVPSPDGSGVVAAYRIERYRPAAGVAAFPDGGISRYDEDRMIVAAIPLAGGPVRVLQRLDNKGLPGSAHVSLRLEAGDPARVLVIHSDQPSTASGADRVERWRLDPAHGEVEPIADIAAELATKGLTLRAKEFGDLRVLDPAGALLVGVTGPRGEALWARDARGVWREIGPLTHFYGVAGDQIYLWSEDQAVLRNWRTGEARVIARYDPVARQTTTLIRNDPTVAAIEQHHTANARSVRIEGGSILVDGRPLPVDLPALNR